MEMTINLKRKISKEWKEFFRKHTDSSDVSKVGLDHDVKYHTLHNIRIGNGNIANEKNKIAIEALAKVAVANANAKIEKYQNDVMSMENSISGIIDND